MDARPLQKNNPSATNGIPVEERIERFREFLYDYGASTTCDIANAHDLGTDRTLNILNDMKESGIVTHFRKGLLTYWVLIEP